MVGSDNFIHLSEDKCINLIDTHSITKDTLSQDNLEEIIENYYKTIGSNLYRRVKNINNTINIKCQITINIIEDNSNES